MRVVWVLFNLVLSVGIFSILILAIGWVDRDKNVTGKSAEKALEKAGITVNKNMIPFDEKSPMITSGIRIGTPAITSRGMKENEMIHIAHLIDGVLTNIDDSRQIDITRSQIVEMCSQFPIYESLILNEMS